MAQNVCCTYDQVTALGDRLAQAAPLISSCPACVNNFRAFYCDFTCSPDQSTFLTVTSTQKTTTGEQAVKSIDYAVSEEYAEGFFDSCKSVQFGATNGFAMDLIGGGAKNASAFLKYMGDLRPGLGSPFQIDFPYGTEYDRKPLSCADGDLNSRCACADCPQVCPALPALPPPGGDVCRVGAVSCLTFSMLLVYAVLFVGGLAYYATQSAIRARKNRYERVALVDPPMSPTTSGGGLESLVGRASSTGDDDSGPSGSIHFRMGRASLLNPMEHLQPKQSQINAMLRRFFYRLGLACASRPFTTFGLATVVIVLLNLGWIRFSVETDPVRLWVSPHSAAAAQKQFFDDNFGPFYRSEQLFITADNGHPVTFETLDWWLKTEEQISALDTSDGVTLQDVCFAPSGPGTACVVQSVSAWLGTDMGQWGDKWEDRLQTCASRPGECLPDFGQPIDPKLVLGGADGHWLEAKALVVTYVVTNYEDGDKRLEPVEEWERKLGAFFSELKPPPGIHISYSTGVSLEEQLNQSTNTDVKIVVLSYLVMFLYVSLALGGGRVPKSEISKAFRGIGNCFHHLAYALRLVSTPPSAPLWNPAFATLPTMLLISSKFTLGLFGIAIVLVAVSSSVGLFSLMGVRVTLIIAEVIPFLVLAVGVDNVFILVHELDRQNAMHAAPDQPPPVDSDDEDELEFTQRTSDLSAEERVARAVARMGPSILLSSTTEVVAFALGALVPMPAVRNFAIYAAGSVLIGALLQVTVFVSAMVLDLKRAEVSQRLTPLTPGWPYGHPPMHQDQRDYPPRRGSAERGYHPPVHAPHLRPGSSTSVG